MASRVSDDRHLNLQGPSLIDRRNVVSSDNVGAPVVAGSFEDERACNVSRMSAFGGKADIELILAH
jgi:hypothetical protein